MTRATRVLVADDDEDVRDTMRDVLEADGYDVIAVGDGGEALSYLDRDRPSLVVLDLQMDEISGWEVLRHLRSDARLRDVGVLVVTGANSPGLPRSVPYLRKPFSRDSLRRAVSDALVPTPAPAQA